MTAATCEKSLIGTMGLQPAVNCFFAYQVAQRRNSPFPFDGPAELVYSFKRDCSDFFSELFFSWPGTYYPAAMRIIEYSLDSLKSSVDEAIWARHILRGETIRKLAYDHGFCEKQMSRKVHSLPKRVADQLILVNENLHTHEYEDCPWRIDQDRIRMLEKTYSLSYEQARTLWLYVSTGGNLKLGRKKILETLHISENTLKSRIKCILRNMRVHGMTEVKDMTDAVDTVLSLLDLDRRNRSDD